MEALPIRLLYHCNNQVDLKPKILTRKLCCRKETALCRSCFYRFKIRHAFTISLTVDKLRQPRLQSSKHIGAKQNLTQMSI